jgi:hypothetical protein
MADEEDKDAPPALPSIPVLDSDIEFQYAVNQAARLLTWIERDIDPGPRAQMLNRAADSWISLAAILGQYGEVECDEP